MTPQEIRNAISADPAILALIPDTVAIASALSVGKTQLVPTEIGAGTILATLGTGGGVFLDTLVTIGESNRDVHWTMDLIKQGRLRIDMPAVRAGMQALAVAVPSLSGAISALLTLGYEPAPIDEFSVRCAIFADDGSLLVGGQ